MKAYNKIIFIILSITILSCNDPFPDLRKKPSPLSDPGLIGLFTQTDCYPNCSVWYKDTRVTTIYFNSNEVIFNQVISDSTGNEKRTWRDLEFYVESGQYQFRDWWGNDSFNEMQPYTLIGNTLTLNNFFNETYILVK